MKMEKSNSDKVFELLKVLIGTIGVTVLTYFLNDSYQQRKIRIEESKNESEIAIAKQESEQAIELKQLESLGRYVQFAIDKDPGTRQRFAEYFATMVTSELLKKNWEFYRDSVVGKEIENIAAEIVLLKSKNDSKENQKRIEAMEKSIAGNVKSTQLAKDLLLEFEVQKLTSEEKFDEAFALNGNSSLVNYEFLKKAVKQESDETITLEHYINAQPLMKVGKPKLYIDVAKKFQSQKEEGNASIVLKDLLALIETRPEKAASTNANLKSGEFWKSNKASVESIKADLDSISISYFEQSRTK